MTVGRKKKRTLDGPIGTGSEWHGLYLRGAYPVAAVEIDVFSPTVTDKTEPHPLLA